MDPLYLTTAIPFVNGAPHLGHALEYVQTDSIARHARSRGRAVRLLTGTDEHAAKNAQAAADAGAGVAAFVARNAEQFRSLAGRLDVSYDDFIRTSTDPRHPPAVEELWRRCAANGDLYRRRYEGWYCGGCEQFFDPSELADGRCPEHDAPLDAVEEENWFFRLSRFTDALQERVRDGRLRIEPVARRNEVLGFLAGGLHDISVSRPRARVRDWGLTVPDDPAQLVYVWFDALANYVSALGFGGDATAFREWWDNEDGSRVHVIGKGIVRFHAVTWPAILLSAGIRLPTTLFVHDYVTVDGRKIGKSLGNTVDPAALVERYGVDALRWWLLREVPRVGETDFSELRLVDTANRDLANGIGNLVQRVSALADRDHVGDETPASCVEHLARACAATTRAIDDAVEAFDLRAATGAICTLVAQANRYVEETKPWALPEGQRAATIASALYATRAAVAELGPFVPALAARATARLGTDGRSPSPGPPLFTRVHTIDGLETARRGSA